MFKAPDWGPSNTQRFRTSTRWCPRSQRIRTVAEIPVQVALVETHEPPIYQLIGAKALQLRQLGLSYPEIGQAVGVTHTTAAKAARWASRELAGSDQAPALSRC